MYPTNDIETKRQISPNLFSRLLNTQIRWGAQYKVNFLHFFHGAPLFRTPKQDLVGGKGGACAPLAPLNDAPVSKVSKAKHMTV